MSIAGALVAGWGTVEMWFVAACDLVRGLRRQVAPLIDGLRPRERTSNVAPAATSSPGGLEEVVREAKYGMPRRGPAALRPTARRAAPGVIGHEAGTLPAAYGGDRLVLLARDPRCLFAYWEITPATREAALRALGTEAQEAPMALRVDTVNAAPRATHEEVGTAVEIAPARGAASCYITVERPGVAYRAELGLRGPSGRFVPLLRSNAVVAPPAQPSADTAVRWIDVRGERAAYDPADDPDSRPPAR